MKVLAYTDVGDGPLSDPLPVTTSQIGTVLFVIFIHQNVGEHIKREKYCNNKINLNYEAMQKILTWAVQWSHDILLVYILSISNITVDVILLILREPKELGLLSANQNHILQC